MRDLIPMTPGGLRKLKDELKKLKTVDRIQNIKEIEVARAHGDLSENAEYHAAKERQSHIAGRIAELEDATSRARVIDPAEMEHKKVFFGATVTLSEADSGEVQTYQIVGIHESDVKNGRISIESPLARTLIGKEEGDTVVLKNPRGSREFEIIKIEYK